MCWIADTEKGDFEAESLRELSNDIANLYAEDEENICDIESVYFLDANQHVSRLSQAGLMQFIYDCEAVNRELIETSREEAEGQRLIEQEYYSSIL